MAMIDDVRLALRITTTAYDAELTDLINAGKADLGVAGVRLDETDPPTDPLTDPLIKKAVVTYVKLHFGSPSDFDKLERTYKEQKAQLATCTGYTDWGSA